MRNFDYGEIPIDSIPKNDKIIFEKKLSKENAISNQEDTEKSKITRRKFLIGTATLALSLGIPKETDLSGDLFKKTIEYLRLSPNDIPKEKKEIHPKKKKIKPPMEEESPMDIESLAYEIQGLARQLLENEHLLPQELFSDNFFTAVQIQESGLKKDAQSELGAIGIMQVRPVTVKEVVRYLNILSKDGLINFRGPDADDLSEKNISDLLNLIKGNGSLGKAFGKLYFADLFNNFEIGKKKFSTGEIYQARKNILAAYNWNPNDFKRNEFHENIWPNETTKYCNKILENIARLDIIHKEIVKLQMQSNHHELSTLLTMELNRYKNIHSKNPFFTKLVHSYLKRINAIEIINSQPLKQKEIQALIDRFNPLSYRLYANYEIKTPL